MMSSEHAYVIPPAFACPSCGAALRVVADQLKVSGGWVRCGVCREVFNALERLQRASDAVEPAGTEAATAEIKDPPPDQAADSPAVATPPASDDAPGGALVTEDVPPALPPSEVSHASQAAPAPQPAVEPADDTPAAWPHAAEEQEEPPQPAASTDLRDLRPLPSQTGTRAPASESVPPPEAPQAAPPDLGPEETPEEAPEGAMPALVESSEAEADADADAVAANAGGDAQPPVGEPSIPDASDSDGDAPATTGVEAEIADANAEVDVQAKAEADADTDTAPAPASPAIAEAPLPSFASRVHEQRHWRSPAVRTVLRATGGVLALLLVWQVTWHFREEVAARSPLAQRWLSAACRVMGCTLQAPRKIDLMLLDATQLSKTAAADVLRLTAEVRNSASFAVRTPAIELLFTDADGRTLVRKVLQPVDFGASAPVALAPGASWRIDRSLRVGTLPIAGFSAELFYP